MTSPGGFRGAREDGRSGAGGANPCPRREIPERSGFDLGDREPGRRRWFLPALFCLALVGCGSGGDGAPDGGESPGDDRPLAWTVEPIYRIGGADAPEWAAFGEVTDLDFDASGALYLLDGPSGRVTVVDALGEPIRTVGSRGEGPGELRYPGGLVVHPGGSVTVLDPGHGGFVVYDAAGEFVANVSLDPEDPGFPTGPLRRGSDGGIYGTGELPLDTSAGDGVADPYRPVVRFSDVPGQEPVVRYRGWRPPLPETRALTAEETGGLNVRLPPVLGFHPELLVAPLPEGRLAVVDSFAYRIRVVGPDGDAVRELRRPLDPRPVTERLREVDRRFRLAAFEASRPRRVVSNREGETAAAPSEAVIRLERARVDAMGFHPLVPVIAGLGADPDGRIWVQRTGPEPGLAGPVDVLDPDRGYLGTLPLDGPGLPDAFGPEGLAAWLETDHLGAAVVRVGRIVESG